MSQEQLLASEDTVEVIDIRASRRALVAGSLGNLIEWYEFATYAYMAPLIAPLFFPSDDPVASMLSTFAVMAMAFFIRPIGAVIFGRMTDRVGRKPALIFIILLMSAGTTAIGLLPTAEAIGVGAAILLVACRLVQGLSAGGEMGGAVSLMVENAPPHKRGVYGSWSFASSSAGFVMGATVATLLTLALPAEDLAEWGWRIPFLLALPLGGIALYIRLRVDETPHFKRVLADRAAGVEPKRKASPVRPVRYTASFLLITAAVVAVYNAVGNTFQVGMPSYLSTAYEMDFLPAYLLALVTGVVAMVTIPIFGALSDRVGRRPVLFWGSLLTVTFSYPLYWLMDQGLVGGIVALFIAGILIGVVGGPMPAFLSERFPTQHRATGVSLVYGLTVTIFGGFAPYVITWLYGVTGDALSGAYYTILVGLISLVGCIAWKKAETQVTHDAFED